MDCITNTGGGRHKADRTNKWKAHLNFLEHSPATGTGWNGPRGTRRGGGVGGVEYLSPLQVERLEATSRLVKSRFAGSLNVTRFSSTLMYRHMPWPLYS